MRSFLEGANLSKSPLVLYDTSATNPWSSRLERGGRYNLYSAVLTAELARRVALTSGVDSVGVTTPYKHQMRLIRKLLEDKERQLKHLNVANVHRFQGLEKDVIIFDIAEGPMPRYGPAQLVSENNPGDLSSDAAKLINVAITRPKTQLIVVANVDYLLSKLSPNAILSRVLVELRSHAEVIDSQDVIDTYFCENFERWASLLDPHNDKIDPSQSTLYTELNFYAAFFADLRKATSEIIIVSPFLAANRAEQFFNLFRSKIAGGIKIRVFTKTLREQRGDMFRQAKMVIDALKTIGVQVVERGGLHEKFAFIDRLIAWEGSANPLSQREGQSTEHMRRLPFAKTCEELIDLHKLGNGRPSASPPHRRQPVQPGRIPSA